jgi:hypothetical protein
LKVGNIVYCHLCVLKDRCEFSAPEESYRFYHWNGFGHYPLSKEENEKLDIALLNCPIRKLIEEIKRLSKK